MAREYFCAYHSMLDQTKRLSDSELGRLFRALLSFSAEGVLPQGLSEKEAVAFDILSSQISRDIEAYEKQCKKNSENGSKGGRPKRKKAEEAQQNKGADDKKSEKSERFSKKAKKANGFLKSQEEEKEEEEYNTLSFESVNSAGAREDTPTENKMSVREAAETVDASSLSDKLKESLRLWILTKGDGYFTDVSISALAKVTESYAGKYGEEAVVNVIGMSISSGWKGICFARLDEKGKPKEQTCGNFDTDEFFYAALAKGNGGLYENQDI